MKKNKNKKSKIMTNKDRVLSKFTTGRTKSIKKRKNTLLLEYKLQNKSNTFVDRRIGERNRNMTAEDKVMARFVAHRVKANKKEIFNLGGDEEMPTHQGRSLLDIEKFDAPMVESDDEDDDGRLDANFVKEAHFGGGLFSKKNSNSSSHQNTIDMLIAESKRKKAEQQQTKEETQNLTDKLDKDLKDLFPFVESKKGDSEEVKPKREAYDVLVRELKFERVGKPSDKLKSEEQVRNEEQARLQKLEEERLNRMKRTVDSTTEEADEPPQKKHHSADDLDDGLDFDIFDDEDDDAEGEDGDDEEGGEEEEEEGDESGSDEEEEKEAPEKEINVEEKQLESEKPTVKKSKPIVPLTLSALKELLAENDTNEKIKLIEDVVKKQQIHCGVSNVEYFIQFFKILLQYLDELFKSDVTKESWTFADKLAPTLFDLVQKSGEKAAPIVLDIIQRKYEAFSSKPKQAVGLDILMILKIVPLLFPTSDYYHPVATPATALLSHVISQNSCKDGQFLARGLFLATVVLEYISLSKRYCPEAVNFLKCVLYTAVPSTNEAVPPVHSKTKILTLKKNCSKKNITPEKLQMSYSNLINENDLKDEDKLACIFTTLRLISAYVNYYENFSAAYAIWNPIVKQLDQLPTTTYPKCFSDKVTEIKTKIKSLSDRPLLCLMEERKRARLIRLYEPNIRPIYEGQSFRTISKAKEESEKLHKEYKREMKGAQRELRKDNMFIKRIRVSEQQQKDRERKQKVKQILNSGQVQQSEYKRIERQTRYRH